MRTRPTAALLPAGITEPTAWCAYKYVFNELDWSLRFAGLSPVTFDLENDEAFLECLKGVAAFGYCEQARAHFCARIAEIVDGMGERHLRHQHYDVDALADDETMQQAALLRMRQTVQARIKLEIENQFNVSVATWADEVDFQLFLTSPSERKAVERYLGVDQLVTDKALRRAVKYVFDCLDLRIGHFQGQAVLLGKPRLKEVRNGRHDSDERPRAWSLVLRAAEHLTTHSLKSTKLNTGASLTVEALRADIEAKIIKSGCWGLIDVVIMNDREAMSLGIPPWASGELLAVIAEQDQRRQLAVGYSS